MSFAFQQNDLVHFDNGVIQGQGKVIGCATIEMPVMGRMFIVEVTDGTLPTNEYPFSAFTVAECHLHCLNRN